mmetsp:Transcript_5138/g.15675  ORF Transcript_5138/g.15675 Transcript_5138/m.15675 type:complete len:149 (+) Transcript_5138:323-769(+)
MAHIDSTAFCEAAAQTDERAESWTVSYFKLAVVCMAAWRLAALVVQLPGKFIPRGTGLLLAGLAASVAGMIFDEVAKVDVMINSKTGQYNRLNVYFPVRTATTCGRSECQSSRSHFRQLFADGANSTDGLRLITCACPSLPMPRVPSW